jgi:hypothetical protein
MRRNLGHLISHLIKIENRIFDANGNPEEVLVELMVDERPATFEIEEIKSTNGNTTAVQIVVK